MKEGQKDVFYMAADSLDAASSAPFVERLVQRDYEVSMRKHTSMSLYYIRGLYELALKFCSMSNTACFIMPCCMKQEFSIWL